MNLNIGVFNDSIAGEEFITCFVYVESLKRVCKENLKVGKKTSYFNENSWQRKFYFKLATTTKILISYQKTNTHQRSRVINLLETLNKKFII